MKAATVSGPWLWMRWPTSVSSVTVMSGVREPARRPGTGRAAGGSRAPGRSGGYCFLTVTNTS